MRTRTSVGRRASLPASEICDRWTCRIIGCNQPAAASSKIGETAHARRNAIHAIDAERAPFPSKDGAS